MAAEGCFESLDGNKCKECNFNYYMDGSGACIKTNAYKLDIIAALNRLAVLPLAILWILH